MLGQTVYRWSDYIETAGVHSVEMSTEGFSSGRYQVQLPGQQVLTAPS